MQIKWKQIKNVKQYSIRTQLMFFFFLVVALVMMVALFLIRQNEIVLNRDKEYLEYLSNISEISNLQESNNTLLGDLVIEVTPQKKEQVKRNIATSMELLERIRTQTTSMDITLRIRVVHYLLQRFGNQAEETIWLKEFEGEKQGANIDYESSYYQVYQKAVDTSGRIESYIREMLVTSIEENKRYLEEIEHVTVQFRQLIWGVLAIVSLVAVSFYIGISRYMTNLVKRLVETTNQLSKGERLRPIVEVDAPREILELTASFNTLLETMEELHRKADEKSKLELQLAAEELEKIKMSELLKQAQLQGLQLQIQPHFLFNTLNVISMMAMMENSYSVYELIVALSKFLRHSLKKQSSLVSLEEEVDMVKQYLYIIKARLGDQVTYEVQQDTTANDLMVPLFTLQPIVENAFKHGLEDRIEPGKLIVQIKQRQDALMLRVMDNGKGMNTKELHRIRRKVAKNHIPLEQEKHIGIENVASRLRMIYEGRVRYCIQSSERRGTVFTVYVKREEE